MPRIFSLLGRRGWAEANECDYIQPLTESRTLSLAVIICTLVTSAHSNLPVRVPDYLGERWSLVTMWCKFKQNWPTFPTQYLLIALVIKYWILMSWHLPILTPIKTAPTSDMDWRSLERILFLSHSILWVSFIYVFTYLLLGVGGQGMGVLSQNSDFINHLLGRQSLCSKLKKNKLHGAPVLLSKLAESPNLHEQYCSEITTYLPTDWLTLEQHWILSLRPCFWSYPEGKALGSGPIFC